MECATGTTQYIGDRLGAVVNDELEIRTHVLLDAGKHARAAAIQHSSNVAITLGRSGNCLATSALLSVLEARHFERLGEED
jgi:hypothetical protein